MAVPEYTVFQGDSSPWRLVRFEDILVSNSTCRQFVRVDLDTTPIIDEAVTDTFTDSNGDEFFRARLDPTDTDSLTVDREYIWIVEISAAGPPAEKRELHGILKVKKQGSTT